MKNPEQKTIQTETEAEIDVERKEALEQAEAENEVTLTKERDHITKLFLELGIDIKAVHPNIVRKLRLLNEKTKKFFEDEEQALHLARMLFRYYEEKLPDGVFTEEEKRIVLVGTIFTDIGKTGPRDATPEQEELILSIFNVESKKPGQAETLSLQTYLQINFPDKYNNMIEKISVISGLSPEMTMRQFWNMHSQWTLDIISGDGVPSEAIAAAAAHHLLEGVNPEEIVGKDGRFTRYFGANISFDRPEKLIIILDKYYAARRRSDATHEEAIKFVSNKIKSNKWFSKDKEFEELLNNLDAMLLNDGG